MSRSLLSIEAGGISPGISDEPVAWEPTDRPWGEWGEAQAEPCPYPHHPRWKGAGGRPVCKICHPPADPTAMPASGAPPAPRPTAPIATVICCLCDDELDPRKGYQRVTGWIRVDGAKGFRTEAKSQDFAHAHCVERVKRVGADQQTLL